MNPKRHSNHVSHWLLIISLGLGIGAHGVFGQTVADTVDWYEDAYERTGEQLTRLFSSDGQDITFQTNFLFQLIADPGSNTSFSALILAGKSDTGWAIGNEHPVAATYGADDDVVVASAQWQIEYADGNDYALLDGAAATEMSNDLGTPYDNTPFYFRWFNTPSAGTASEAGIIYRNNGEWVTSEPTEWPGSPTAHEAYLGYDEPTNLGSTNATGWQAMPRALLTTRGTPMRWFVAHGIALEPGDSWDDADTYDSDTNGILNRAEYIAGTDPMDPDSVLKILDINITPGASNWTTELTWHGAKGGDTNTLWHLYAATNGIAPPAWHAITDGTNTITGNGTNTWTRQSPTPSTLHFYRIQATTP